MCKLLMQPRMLLAVFDARVHDWLIFILLSTRTHRSFPAELLLNPSGPTLYVCLQFLLPRDRNWHLTLLDFIRFLSGSLWTAALPWSMSTAPLQFGVIRKFDEIFYTEQASGIGDGFGQTFPSKKPLPLLLPFSFHTFTALFYIPV